jgi:c(7)-type cytochrome triheme protein
MFRGFTVVFGALLMAVPVLTSCSPSVSTATRSAGDAGEGNRWRDQRFFAKTVKTEALAADGIHDPKNNAITTLQEPAEAMSAFPLDRRGDVDWVKAINLGIIEPRADLLGKTQMPILDTDILFKDTAQMPWVKFPHKAHTQWLSCSNCHPDIFIQKKGANNLSMNNILAGEYCGRCHGRVSFAQWTCERCHNTPHTGTPETWTENFGTQAK